MFFVSESDRAGGERKKTGCLFSLASSTILVGSFSNDDGDGNENVKKQ